VIEGGSATAQWINPIIATAAAATAAHPTMNPPILRERVQKRNSSGLGDCGVVTADVPVPLACAPATDLVRLLTTPKKG
jgi:hypothetical protein